jgi:hypothetical protein
MSPRAQSRDDTPQRRTPAAVCPDEARQIGVRREDCSSSLNHRGWRYPRLAPGRQQFEELVGLADEEPVLDEGVESAAASRGCDAKVAEAAGRATTAYPG